LLFQDFKKDLQVKTQSDHIDSSKKVNHVLLDCTLRDGGYYNDWDFSSQIINNYLAAMDAAEVNVVELGFRFWHNEGFKAPVLLQKMNFSSDQRSLKRLKLA
jgi:isopropylmalate/homocitrate/citramalate synthase